METFIIRYGLVAVFLGAGIEGEPFALAGGVLAHRHLLSVWAAAIAAIAGSCLVDQGWFHLARWARDNRWVQAVARRPAFARSIEILDGHPVWFVLLFRFAYGLRAVAPVAIGMSRVRSRLFVPLNILAAIAWGALFTALGYASGPLFERLERKYGSALAIAAILLSLTALLLALRRGQLSGRARREEG